MEGEGLAGPFYHVNDVGVYLGRQREEESLIEWMHFAHDVRLVFPMCGRKLSPFMFAFLVIHTCTFGGVQVGK